MKPTLIMAEDVQVDTSHPDEASAADVVSTEILKTVALPRVDHPEWSSASSTKPCSQPLKCYSTKKPSSFLHIVGNELVGGTTDRNFNTFALMSAMNDPGVRAVKLDTELNGSATAGSSTPEKNTSNHTSADPSPQKQKSVVAPKKSTPKLMRTPSNTIIRKRCTTSGQSPHDGKRLDEELEELDAHLMSTTLKNVKFMQGPKFTVFNDIAFQRECLESHNKVRQLYGCPALNWCQELADQAEAWAQSVAERGRILYKELPGIGENISLLSANGSNHLPTGNEVTEQWASEVQHYNFAKPGWLEKCQHFTQLIWKRSTEFGVGRVWLPSKSLVAIVAFYAPSGNCNGINEFRDNVPKPVEGGPSVFRF